MDQTGVFTSLLQASESVDLSSEASAAHLSLTSFLESVQRFVDEPENVIDVPCEKNVS